METLRPIRQYVTIERPTIQQNGATIAQYINNELPAVTKALTEIFRSHDDIVKAFNGGGIKIVGLPSLKWLMEKAAQPTPDRADPLIFALEFASRSLLDAFARAVGSVNSEKPSRVVRGPVADLAFGPADHWCPGAGGQYLFSTRRFAESRMGVDTLRAQGLDGQGVNVVIVDQGVDERKVPQVVDRWRYLGKPPTGSRPEHGTRVALNVLSIAPRARIFDLPLIPWSLADLNKFVSDAQSAFETVRMDIATLGGTYPGPWVMVNAWAVFDRRLEVPEGDYTEKDTHLFNRRVAQCGADGIDLVFAAGNCGQFCPNQRCGQGDIGPGRSIMGANSLASVLTVGGVRTDAMWTGFSSQGPGMIAPQKPDLCAPTQFSEDADAHVANTGTSAACALAGGIVAALRGRWSSAAVPPDRLRQVLRDTARPPAGAEDTRRTGHGVIDAAAAYATLAGTSP